MEAHWRSAAGMGNSWSIPDCALFLLCRLIPFQLVAGGSRGVQATNSRCQTVARRRFRFTRASIEQASAPNRAAGLCALRSHFGELHSEPIRVSSDQPGLFRKCFPRGLDCTTRDDTNMQRVACARRRPSICERRPMSPRQCPMCTTWSQRLSEVASIIGSSVQATISGQMVLVGGRVWRARAALSTASLC